MLIRKRDNKLLVILQTDHANLSAQLAANWGNDKFDKPVPFSDMMLAAAGHDDGWMYKDEMPALNGLKRPSDLFADGIGKSLQIHKDTIDLAKKRSAYSALIVSMHRTGLMQALYGIEAGSDPAVEKQKSDLGPEVREWILREEKWQRNLRKENAVKFVDDTHLWMNYKLLQVWDRLSLYLCYLSDEKPRKARLFPTPTTYGGVDVTLSMKPSRRGGIGIDPWPFEKERVSVSVRARLIEDTEYASSFQVAKELLRSRPVIIRFGLAGRTTTDA